MRDDAPLFTRMRFRMALWCAARSMPFRAWSGRPLDSVLSLASPAGRAAYVGLSAEYVLHQVLAVTRRPYLMRERRCLRQGLLAYRFLAAAGHDIELHFGIDAASLHSNSLRAHCWVVHHGRIILNPPHPDTVVIFVHSTRAPATTFKIPADID